MNIPHLVVGYNRGIFRTRLLAISDEFSAPGPRLLQRNFEHLVIGYYRGFFRTWS